MPFFYVLPNNIYDNELSSSGAWVLLLSDGSQSSIQDALPWNHSLSLSQGYRKNNQLHPISNSSQTQDMTNLKIFHFCPKQDIVRSEDIYTNSKHNSSMIVCVKKVAEVYLKLQYLYMDAMSQHIANRNDMTYVG